jgi:hypothetical protein
MGGVGSGTWRRRSVRRRVDHCLTLDTQEFLRSGVFGHCYVSFAAEELAGEFHDRGDEASMLVKGTFPSGSVNQWLLLVATFPNYGGRRLWFSCPRTGDRVRKLYLPFGEIEFASRRGYELTYRSCQESGSMARIIAGVGAWRAKIQKAEKLDRC